MQSNTKIKLLAKIFCIGTATFEFESIKLKNGTGFVFFSNSHRSPITQIRFSAINLLQTKNVAR